MPWILSILTTVLIACNPQSDSPPQTSWSEDVTVFQNVNVITMDGESVLANQNVIIDDGTIARISADEEIPPQAEIINGEGKYLIPGLAEMHAHIPTAEAGDLVNETLFLYLAGGVTTIRGMLGHPSHLELRSEVANGSTLGPHIYTSGPSINGFTAPSIEKVEEMVSEQKAAGYDFLKLHPGLKIEVFDALVSKAAEVGITFAGHVSRDVGVRHALASKYATIDHIDGYVEGMVPESVEVNPQENGFFGMNFTDLVDMGLLQELLQSTRDNEVWIVPTQCLAERWSAPVSIEELQADGEMQFMPKSTLDQWVNAKTQMMSSDDYDPERAQRFIELRRQIIKAMQDSGVGILLGSDAPQVFNVPGFAIWHEIEMYVAAGLTPYQALLTGTANPARFLKNADRRGFIKEGYEADLILLDNNPLENISAVRQQSGVMIGGTWLNRETIDGRLQELAIKYQNQ